MLSSHHSMHTIGHVFRSIIFFKLKCLFLVIALYIWIHLLRVVRFQLIRAVWAHTYPLHIHMFKFAMYNGDGHHLISQNVWLRPNRCRSPERRRRDRKQQQQEEKNNKHEQQQQQQKFFFDMSELTSEVISWNQNEKHVNIIERYSKIE